MSDLTDHESKTCSDEYHLLMQLRDTPEIFVEIEACSPAELRNQKRLRERFDEPLVREALALADVRRKAEQLLPSANRLWLTRTGLEQSTAWTVAQHKAARFRQYLQSHPQMVYDLCSGIGVDAAALADVAEVTGVDSDAAMCLRMQWNAELWNTAFPVHSLCADVTATDWGGKVVHADPDRRGGRDRPVKRLELYQPDLSWMQKLASSADAGAIKLGPASNFMQKFPGSEIELISLHGECREATVWFGDLAGAESFRATVLPCGETVAADPLSAWAPQAAECDAYIFDPDPAVVRSGMLDVVAERLGLSRLDPEEEYLTGPRHVVSGFVTGFRVEAVLPNNFKEVRHWVRRHPSTHYELKCRRIPMDAVALRRQLSIGDAAPRVILFVRIQGKARIVIASRISELTSLVNHD